ncbi:MAG: hypothetical protein V1726_00865 [Methanobacteriota archaeon]
MTREFTRNMFIMLIAIMSGVIIITFFASDIIRRSQIETLNIEHKSEIQTITNLNQNFTDHFFQGIVKMDSAREIREVGNYHFDFALFWYTNARNNNTEEYTTYCLENCTDAMTNYLRAYQNFNLSKPYFEKAKTYTNQSKYLQVLGYYVGFAQAGKNITLLRYTASQYLKQAMENFSVGNIENATMLMQLFNETEILYGGAVGAYEEYRGQIDEYWFFDEIRESH